MVGDEGFELISPEVLDSDFATSCSFYLQSLLFHESDEGHPTFFIFQCLLLVVFVAFLILFGDLWGWFLLLLCFNFLFH